MKKLNLLILYFVLATTASSAYAASSCHHLSTDHLVPESINETDPRLYRSQPTQIRLMGSQVLVHNKEIAGMLQKIGDHPTEASLLGVVNRLSEENAFDFPLTDEGFLPAANNGEHHGGYGSYVWYRDLARAFKGVAALPSLSKKLGQNFLEKQNAVTKMAGAMIGLFSEKEQVIRTLKNIVNPNFHKDPANGYRNVIFVRLGLEGRIGKNQLTKENIETESDWGHKQNDAVALYAHTILDGLVKGEISMKDFTLRSRAELLYLVSYFQRIEFQRMQDVGAWEERMGVRTSSLGLVTGFLERFNDGWTQNETLPAAERELFKNLRKEWEDGSVYKELSTFIAENKTELPDSERSTYDIINQGFLDLPHHLDTAYKILFERLGIQVLDNGSRIYSEVKELEQGRTADAAILHLLLHPLKRLTTEDRLHVVNDLKKHLMKDSGFVRYKEDWFLYGGPNAVESSGRLLKNPNLIAVQDEKGFRQSSQADRDQIYAEYQKQKYEKDMSGIIEKNGAGLEAQWSFQDSMLTQIYVQLYKETHDEKLRSQAWFHLARALSWVTGENQINVEGVAVKSWRAPEAWIPVRMVGDDGKVFTTYLTSPNSPLNWTTAELVTALNCYLQITTKSN